MIDLSIDTGDTRKILTTFIRSQVTRAGFQRGVIGLSGGIDSALSCYLTAEALGAENVLALRLPYRTSAPDSLEHAQMIIDVTGVQAQTIEITPMVDAYLEKIPDAGQIRRGNVMARARMTILYDQSAAFNGLVIGTGNKTEILLGYTTLYGDSACALNPIGDLYKTQVRQLAKDIGIPEIIISKPPSADLWQGQTDEGELGFTYANVDQLLFLLIDQRNSPDECVAAGFDKGFVAEVIDRIMRNHYKRVMPPVARLSNRTDDYDFLHPRDWKT